MSDPDDAIATAIAVTAIDKLSAIAAGFRGTFMVGDGGMAYEPSPDDAAGDGPRVTFQQAVVDFLNAIGPALDEVATLRSEVARLRRHFDAAGPEHDLPALLDLYFEREQAALAEAAKLRSELREIADEIDRRNFASAAKKLRALTDPMGPLISVYATERGPGGARLVTRDVPLQTLVDEMVGGIRRPRGGA